MTNFRLFIDFRIVVVVSIALELGSFHEDASECMVAWFPVTQEAF